MIPLNEESKVFVLCPAYSKTGGPELLHQLVCALNNNGINAKITYYNTTGNPNYTPNDFQRYIQEFELYDNIKDCQDCYIVFPEVITKEIIKFKKAKKIIWWLSVDNYFKQRGIINSLRFYGLRGTLHLIRRGNFYINDTHLKQADYHLCQSHYAINFLKTKRLKNIGYLSDYINDSFFETQPIYNTKKDYILYNPKKGLSFTKKLIQQSQDLNWIPIKGMSTEEVRNLLLSSKVYVDFGNHPGKDRFPREAAICGCCVLTNKRGSARFTQDVPIPEQYKFDNESPSLIVQKIRQCVTQYDNEIKHFKTYRNVITEEKQKFSQDVKNIFKLKQID